MWGRLPKRRVSSPSPLLFKCWAHPWLRAHPHFSPCLEPRLSEPSPVMSSLSGSAVGGDKVLEGSEKEAKAPETSPPTSRKRGRPKGSRNKKTLEALAAAAAIAPPTSVATRATRAPGDVGVPEKRGPSRPKGSGRKTAPAVVATPSSPRRRGWPPGSKNKKTLAVLGATASTSARPRAVASPPVGPSRPWSKKPALQPPAYISTEGWSTSIIPVLAGAQHLLCLPS
jgi:hypothetical protein